MSKDTKINMESIVDDDCSAAVAPSSARTDQALQHPQLPAVPTEQHEPAEKKGEQQQQLQAWSVARQLSPRATTAASSSRSGTRFSDQAAALFHKNAAYQV
jgi:hypothetical protein